MKRAERHRLKENEFATLARNTREVVEARSGQVLGVVVTIVVVLAATIGYFAWRERVEARAGSLLAEAMIVDEARVGPQGAEGTPAAGLTFATAREKYQTQLTKFKVVADEYPSTDAGVFARYREAATRMSLGMPSEAATAFQQVIDHSGNDLYTQMAKLGLAEAHARAGKFDLAISTYMDLAQRTDEHLPLDGVLMQLGRTYRDAGKRVEAEQTFNRIISEFPGSPFSDQARKELETLKRT